MHKIAIDGPSLTYKFSKYMILIDISNRGKQINPSPRQQNFQLMQFILHQWRTIEVEENVHLSAIFRFPCPDDFSYDS
jgi:hypothetical protein